MKEDKIRKIKPEPKVKKSINENPITLDKVFYDLILNNQKYLIEKIAEVYRKENTCQILYTTILAKELSIAIKKQVEGVADYFTQNFNKVIANNLVKMTDDVTNKYINENKDFHKKFDKCMNEYMKNMKIEDNIMQFINSKKEIFIEGFIKNLFVNKN
jgi:hypothetical protein